MDELIPLPQKRELLLQQGLDEIKEKLSKRFPKNKVKKREGPKGIMLDYITWSDIAERMNEVFPGLWSMEIGDEKRAPLGDKEEVIVKVKVTTPLGTQEAYGSGVFDKNNRNDKYSDALQKATHQGFKRAVAPWGPGLNLYSKDDDAGDGEDLDALTRTALKAYCVYVGHELNIRAARKILEESSFPVYETIWGMIINNVRDGTPLP